MQEKAGQKAIWELLKHNNKQKKILVPLRVEWKNADPVYATSYLYYLGGTDWRAVQMGVQIQGFTH